MGEVKKKKKEELYASKKSYLKDDNTNSSQDLYPRITIVIARGSIINGVIEDRLRRKNYVVKARNFPGANVDDMLQNLMPRNLTILLSMLERMTSKDSLQGRFCVNC